MLGRAPSVSPAARRASASALCAALIFLLFTPVARAANDETLASTGVRTPVSAGSGWVVWSARDGGIWRLMGRHRGVVRRLPIRARSVPFDADVGTDRHGHAVITFSRCSEEPLDVGAGVQAWWLADGCSTRVVDLGHMRERSAGVPRRRGQSDSTPSMWEGRLAFARRDGPRRRARVLVFDPRTRRTRALAGDGFGSTGSGVAVEALDLGSRVAASLWYARTGAGPSPGWEVAADILANRRRRVVGTGFVGEACTGGDDLSRPAAPTTTGWTVTYSQLTSSCYHDRVDLVRADVRSGRFSRGSLEGEVLESSWALGSGVVLLALDTAGPPGARCDAAGAPCELRRVVTPPLSPFSPSFRPSAR